MLLVATHLPAPATAAASHSLSSGSSTVPLDEYAASPTISPPMSARTGFATPVPISASTARLRPSAICNQSPSTQNQNLPSFSGPQSTLRKTLSLPLSTYTSPTIFPTATNLLHLLIFPLYLLTLQCSFYLHRSHISSAFNALSGHIISLLAIAFPSPPCLPSLATHTQTLLRLSLPGIPRFVSPHLPAPPPLVPLQSRKLLSLIASVMPLLSSRLPPRSLSYLPVSYMLLTSCVIVKLGRLSPLSPPPPATLGRLQCILWIARTRLCAAVLRPSSPSAVMITLSSRPRRGRSF
ncbi:hypothetical protein R3P38DRAFT_3202146 [Favolaschia claudopus]|uniref:Uncharacterized protein n=1 Tax=Favolaschia claudopus TaxID=2862362 RepID=A0AAW0AVV0_9AGAR